MNYINNVYFRNIIVPLVVLIFPFLFGPQGSDLQVPKGQFNWDEIGITIPVYVRFGGGHFNFPDLVEATQLQIDAEIEHISEMKIKLLLVDELDLKQQNPDDDDNNNLESLSSNKYSIELVFSGENTVAIDPELLKVYHSFNLESIHSNDLPFLITQSVIYHLFSPEFHVFKNGITDLDERKFKVLIIMDDTISVTQFLQFQTLIASYVSKIDGLFNLEIEFVGLESSLRSFFLDKSNLTTTFTYACTLDEFVDKNLDTTDKVEDSSNNTNVQMFIGQLKKLSNDPEIWLDSMTSIIEELLRLPVHPTNNIALKTMSLRRFKTLQYIKATQPKDSTLQNLVDRIFNEPLGDWSLFYFEAKQLYNNR